MTVNGHLTTRELGIGTESAFSVVFLFALMVATKGAGPAEWRLGPLAEAYRRSGLSQGRQLGQLVLRLWLPAADIPPWRPIQKPRFGRHERFSDAIRRQAACSPGHRTPRGGDRRDDLPGPQWPAHGGSGRYVT
jgi:hypothetical protein